MITAKMNNKTEDAIPEYCDVAVVGAGIGGLICAVELARQGKKVCVLEKHRVPGGYAHRFRRHGYRFDISLHHIGGLESGFVTHGLLASLGVLDKIKYGREKNLFTAEFPEFSVVLPNNREALIETLCTFSPEQSSGIRRLFKFLETLKSDIISPVIDPLFQFESKDRISNKYLNKTFDDLLKEFISDPKLLAILGQLWIHVGLPPALSSANFSTCVYASALVEGSYYLVGGGFALIAALVERLRELGGDCYVESEVEKIVVNDNAINGVVLQNGKKILTDIVVSGVDPFNTFNKLLNVEDTSKIFTHRVSQMVPSLSMYSLYLGLNCKPDSLGVPHGNSFYNYQMNCEESYNSILEGDVSNTSFEVTNHQDLDKSLSPEGCGIVTFVELTESSDWMSLSDEDYQIKKAEIQSKLLKKYTNKFQGLVDHIKVQEFATPRTMARFTNNHHGAIYGFAQTVEQSNSKRLRNRTSIKGLYLTGAWTWSGGGYEGAMISGVQTAMAVMDEENLEYTAPKISLHPEYLPDNTENTEHRASAISIVDSGELESHYKYEHAINVYGDDLNAQGNVDASSYVRYLDRGRMECVEEICQNIGKNSWLETFVVNVYRIEARCATVIGLNDSLVVKTGFRKLTTHRAAFDQRIINIANGDILVDASIEVLFLTQDMKLVAVPDGVNFCKCILPDFSLDRTEPLPFTDEEHFPFRTSFRVYYEDTDCQKITYHVSYVRFCERALFDIIRTVWPAVSTNTWVSKNKVAVAKIDIRYLKASGLGDRIEVRTGIIGVTKEKLIFGQRIINVKTGQVLTDAVTNCEFRDAKGNIVEIPRQIAELSKANMFASSSVKKENQ